MKKLIFLFSLILIISCATKKVATISSLYEILTEQKDGGASIQFYEMITEEKEINMLLNDDNLKNKIQAADIKTANFVIVNAGKKAIGNNNIEIESVSETNSNIIVKIKKSCTANTSESNANTVNPYIILKINSKKEIIFE